MRTAIAPILSTLQTTGAMTLDLRAASLTLRYVAVLAFPWSQLPHLSRAEVLACRDFAARIQSLHLGAVFATLSDAGVPCSVQLGPAQVTPQRRGLDVGILLGFSSNTVAEGLLFEFETECAAALVAELLRKSEDRPRDLARELTDRIYGASAAALVHLLRKAGNTPMVLASGPSHALYTDLAQSVSIPVSQPITLTVRGRSYRAMVTGAPLQQPSTSSWTPQELTSLGAARIALPVVVASVLLEAEMLGSLQEGDLLTLGEIAETYLAAPRSEWALKLKKREASWIYQEQIALPWSAEATEGESSMNEVLQTVPLVARIELGSVEMTAAEWSRLSPGDTLTLGKKPGEPVTVRIGGVAVARGELVVFEGQTAVRITERIQMNALRESPDTTI